MASLNQVNLIGNLVSDPKIVPTQTGKTIVKFSIATNSSYKKQDGTKVDDTQFHNCVAFGKLGEIISKWQKKGSSIYICGKLKTSNWVGDDGVKKYKTEIVASEMQMLGGKKSTDSSDPSTPEKEERIDVNTLPF